MEQNKEDVKRLVNEHLEKIILNRKGELRVYVSERRNGKLRIQIFPTCRIDLEIPITINTDL